MTSKSCITDKPVSTKDGDSLQAQDYARALSLFIQHADTPVTIGIQGGWGSGKTSLISMLQELLDKDEAHTSLCVCVNAWEHSLFQDANSKMDVALSLLGGLADGIEQSVVQATWMGRDVRDRVNKNSQAINAALGALKFCLRLSARIAVQAVANAAGAGEAVSGTFEDKREEQPEQKPIAQHVHELRESLREQVARITQGGTPGKIVFFIDDLDRVPPATAVEILDITKNIFDIPNCVFILAIDYEVVVKGLEGKFGPKSRENEREFRQYFDKIIQIPFTMPIGAYATHIADMLQPALEQLGLPAGEDGDLLKRLAEDATLATGGIPRSIKRIVNTLSLLNYIAKASREDTDSSPKAAMDDLEARFIIVALHINFPEICRRIMERSAFTQWKRDELDKVWKLESTKYTNELAVLEKSDLFNDEWEKALYCLCAQSDWLKAQAKNISQLLNNLLVALNGKKDQSELSEEGLTLMADILDSIRVVSIDTETSIQEIDDSSVKTDSFTYFCRQLHEKLAKALPKGILGNPTNEYAKRPSAGFRQYYTPMTNGKEFYAEWEKENNRLSISILGATAGSSEAVIKSILKKYTKDIDAYDYSEKHAEFWFTSQYDDVPANSFRTLSAADYADDTVKLYEAVCKAEKELSAKG